MSKLRAEQNELIQLSQNLWTAKCPQKFLGLEFGARMTVIRFSSKELLLHSPVPIDDMLKKEIDSLGEVKFIVAPNKFHHLHVRKCKELYPEAQLWGAPGLREKLKDIKFDGEICEETRFGPEGELEQFIFRGIPSVNEAVFYHHESKTLILTDLLFNFNEDISTGFKLILRLDGIYGGPKVSRLTSYILLKDKDKAHESAQKLLSYDFDRVVLAHREIIPTGGKEIVRKAFECFGA